MRYKLPYSLFKRGKYYYYRTYNPDGTRTTAHSTGHTNKARAMAFCEELIKYNRLTGERKISAYDYALHFYDDDSVFLRDRATKLTPRTLNSYRQLHKTAILPELKGVWLNEINYTWLKEMRARTLDKGYSVSTTITIMSQLKKILQYAFRDNLIMYNPCDKLEPLKLHDNGRDAFTLEEVKFLYDNILPEYKNLILFIALTGLRISEAHGVRPCDILEGNGFSYIHLTEQYIKNNREPLKNKQSRDIPIIPELKEFLCDASFSPSRFYRFFIPLQRKCEDAIKRKLSIHSLRHFFITNTKSEGVNDLKVEKIAGHSLKGIQGVYTNFKKEDLTDILEWQEKTLKKISG